MRSLAAPLLLLLLLLLLGSAEVRGALTPDLQIAIPVRSIAALIASELPPIEKKVDNTTLPTCCYDDVGVANVHLDMQSMKLETTNLFVGLTTPSNETNVIQITVVAQTTLAGSYRLCLHDDPFGHGCSTIQGCKGDFAVTPVIRAVVPLGVAATAAGGLQLQVGNVVGEMASLHNNFCDLFSKQIESHLAEISADVHKAVVSAVGKAAAQIADTLPRSIAAGSKVNITIDAANGTSIGPDTIVLSLSVDTVLKPSGSAGPFQPRYPLPAAIGADGRYHVRTSDSLLSNALWTLFQEHTMRLRFNATVALDKWQLQLTVVSPGPTINFNATQEIRLILPCLLTGTNSASGESIATFTQWSLAVQVSVESTGQNNISLALLLTKDTKLDSTGGNCTGTCLAVVNKLSETLAIDVDIINAVLSKTRIPLPLPSAVNISNASLTQGNGFLEIAADLAPALEEAEMPLWVPSAIKCPDIKGAHQDSCI